MAPFSGRLHSHFLSLNSDLIRHKLEYRRDFLSEAVLLSIRYYLCNIPPTPTVDLASWLVTKEQFRNKLSTIKLVISRTDFSLEAKLSLKC